MNMPDDSPLTVRPDGSPADGDTVGNGPRSKTVLPATVIALGWVSLLTDVASEMIFPLLPGFIDTQLKAGKLGLGLIEGVAESVSSLLRLPSGAWSDRMKSRKPLILAGYGLAGLVRPLMGLVTAPWQALVIRTLDRFGKGVRGAPRDAMIAEVTPQKERGRAFGFHRAMDHAGAAIGPLLAFTFLTFWPDQLRTLFLLAMIPGIGVVIVVWFGVREPDARGTGGEEARLLPKAGALSGWTMAPFSPRFRWFLVALAVFTLGNSSDAFLLLRAEELGVTKRYLPLLWFLLHVAKSTANQVAGRWSDRYDPRKLLIAGWLIYALVYVGFGWADNVPQAAVLFLLYAMYYGLTEPAEKTLVARWVAPELRGTAFGWFHLAVGVMALPASALFGLIWKSTPWSAAGAFGFGAALALLAAVVLAVTGFGGKQE